MTIGILKLLSRAVINAGVLALLVAGPATFDTAKAETSVAVDFFYDDLAPQGYWVRDRYYGTVWYPSHRQSDWQPYVDGRWVWTVDYGWYWESYEDFGWATYHYGRWVYTADYGWVWVPGDEWGPAWVEWRYGGGSVGWAPMPPEATWRGNSLVYVGVDISAPRYRASWVFVSEGDFARGNITARRIPATRNAAMFGTTVRTGGYAAVNGRIVNRGVDVAQVSAAAKVRIAPVAVVQSQSRVYAGPRVAGRVTVYQPRVVAKTTLGVTGVERGQTRFDTDERLGTTIKPPVGGSAGGNLDIGRGSGGIGVGGVGVGGGLGGGGGVRIGR